MLKETLKDLSNHSFFYSLVWVTGSAASILLLPIYTRYLSRSDYGMLELLDYTNTILTIIIGAGLSAAIPKFFNDAASIEEKKKILSTSTIFILAAGAAIGALAMLESERIAEVILGKKDFEPYIHLNIILLYAQLAVFVSGLNFIVRKDSKGYLAYMLIRMAVTVSMNIFFIVGMDWGVYGMLYGNIVGNVAGALIMTIKNVNENGIKIDIKILNGLLKFGTPLIPATLLATLMHNVDKYLIRYFCSLDDVGIYSLGYKFPFMLNVLTLHSFNLIWTGATIYEVEKGGDSAFQFGRIATYVLGIYIFAQTALSVYGDAVIRIFADPKFYAAHQVIPFISLGLCFHAFFFFFSIGTLLKKKTWLVNLAYLPAAAISVVGNSVLLPKFGYLAAGWIAVATYFVFALVLYITCRKLVKIDYEFKRIGILLIGGIATYLASSHWVFESLLWEILKGAAFLVIFCAALFIGGWFHKGEMEQIKKLFKIEEIYWLLKGKNEILGLLKDPNRPVGIGGLFQILGEGLVFTKLFCRHFLKRRGNRAISSEINKKQIDVEVGMSQWINHLFAEKSGWKLKKSEYFPYSEIHIVSGEGNGNSQDCIVIKKFKANFEDPENTSHDKFLKEKEALLRVAEVDGLYGVTVPGMVGFEEHLNCMATNFIEGRTLINELLRDPFRAGRLIKKTEVYEEQFQNLGRWLLALHGIGTASLDADSELQDILARDLEGIGMRVMEMGERKKKDFSAGVCRRILKNAEEAKEKILAEEPKIRDIHGDFSLANILSTPRGSSVLDFATFGRGLAEDDLARIYLDLHSIDTFTFWLHPSLQGKFAQSFFSGYGRDLNYARRATDRFYLLKHIIINIYMYSVNWDDTRQFLDPFLCRILYNIQKRYLLRWFQRNRCKRHVISREMGFNSWE